MFYLIIMACVTTNAKILIRRDTAANWTATNPVLLDGEQGYEKDTGKMKIGDGVKTWSQLSYFPNIPTTFFDGGYPSIVYTSGPVFDMGGVN
jgi:hypothetical protein